jgi:WXG100 family type VII secretion target
VIIRTDFVALVGETTRLATAHEEMAERVKAARARTHDVLDVGWTGDSAAAFRSAFEEWATAADRSTSELSRLIEALRSATVDIHHREEATDREIRNLGGSPSIPGLHALMDGGR